MSKEILCCAYVESEEYFQRTSWQSQITTFIQQPLVIEDFIRPSVVLVVEIMEQVLG